MRDSGSLAWATGDAINKARGRGQRALGEGGDCVKKKIMPHLGHVNSNVGTEGLKDNAVISYEKQHRVSL